MRSRGLCFGQLWMWKGMRIAALKVWAEIDHAIQRCSICPGTCSRFLLLGIIAQFR